MKAISLFLIFFLFGHLGFSQNYKFTGNGNWSEVANWNNNAIPPLTLLSGDTIFISPSTGDSCVLDTPQVISPGASLIISTGANFILHNYLSINNHIPILSTTAVTDKLACYALAGGNIASDGGNPVIARGVVWSTHNQPTLIDSFTIDGTGRGNFSSTMMGLYPGITYYVRAYATNGNGTAYGNEISFTRANLFLPNNTADPSSITHNSAVSGGFIDASPVGCTQIYNAGVIWDTTADITVALSTKTIQPAVFSQWYTSSITNLLPAKTYYVRAYFQQKNGEGTVFYGTVKAFNTFPQSIITLSTTNVSTITAATAKCGGTIIYDGGNAVTARGIVWNTVSNPTIALATKTTDGAGMGSYSSNISGLLPATTYYVRAYATNTFGTSYGNEVSFTTISGPSITICTQVWMPKNLDVVTYRNGDTIPQVTDPTQWASLTTGAWCYYNNDSVSNAVTYGKLYNWYAINDSRGLAPAGWHIPTNAEWTTLLGCFGGNATAAANALKETGTAHWNALVGGGTNSSGFSAVPGGYRYLDGSFSSLSLTAIWWCSDAPGTKAYDAYINSQGLVSGINYKGIAYSVRCIGY